MKNEVYLGYSHLGEVLGYLEQKLFEFERALLDLEKEPTQELLINYLLEEISSVRRKLEIADEEIFHSSLKVLYQMESVLTQMQQGDLPVQSRLIDLLLKGHDYLRDQVAAWDRGLPAQSNHEKVIESLASVIAGEVEKEKGSIWGRLAHLTLRKLNYLKSGA